MILVPLPRRVGPTAKPLFSRSRRLHRRTPHPNSACPAHTDAAPEASAPPPASRCESTAGIGDGRSGTEGTSPADRATALRCPEPRTLRSAPRECHATVGHDYPIDALKTQHRLRHFPLFFGQLPASCHRRLRRYSEHLQNAPSHALKMFMRLVLGSSPPTAPFSYRSLINQTSQRNRFVN